MMQTFGGALTSGSSGRTAFAFAKRAIADSAAARQRLRPDVEIGVLVGSWRFIVLAAR
jgi:hypothetical protein